MVSERMVEEIAYIPSGRSSLFKGVCYSQKPKKTIYQVIKAHEEHPYLILKINYPSCNANYEGNKILVFKDVTLIDLINQKEIDPHFFQDPVVKSPIARFVPTDEGWQYAITFVQKIKEVG